MYHSGSAFADGEPTPKADWSSVQKLALRRSLFRLPFIPKRQAKVGFDTRHDCWRIYVWDQERGHGRKAHVHWWPLLWLKFASREVAEDHLEMYGDYST